MNYITSYKRHSLTQNMSVLLKTHLEQEDYIVIGM